MSTIGSSISAAGQCGLAYNEAITANNDKVVAQIELNQASNQAANQMNLAGSKATEASGLSQAELQRQAAFGQLASAIGGGVVGFGAIGMESYYANSAAKIAQNSNPNSMDIEMTEIPPKAVAPTTGDTVPVATNSAGTVVANNNNVDVEAPVTNPTTTTAAKAPVERVKTQEEEQAIKMSANMGKIGNFLPGAVQNAAQAGGQLAAAQAQEAKAKADAMATAAQGLSQLASRNADAATSAQQAAENNKDSLIKALEAMILANRAG